MTDNWQRVYETPGAQKMNNDGEHLTWSGKHFPFISFGILTVPVKSGPCSQWTVKGPKIQTSRKVRANVERRPYLDPSFFYYIFFGGGIEGEGCQLRLRRGQG